MAYGDIAETVTGNTVAASLTVTYTTATPVAKDLNALSCFTGATSITSLTAGFTQRSTLTDAGNEDEGAVAEQRVADSNDDTCTLTPSESDEIMMVMSLVEGPFDASPFDLTDKSAEPSSADPVTTGTAVGPTAQASEISVAAFTQRDDNDENPTWANTGTATPTDAPSETGTDASSAKRVYQAIHVFTGVGTVGMTASNANTFACMLGFATYKEEIAGRIMSSLAAHGGLVAKGGIAGSGGGLAG